MGREHFNASGHRWRRRRMPRPRAPGGAFRRYRGFGYRRGRGEGRAMERGRRGMRGCSRGSMGGEDPAIEKMETLKHSSIFLDYPASLLMPVDNLPLKEPRNSRRNHGPEAKSSYSSKKHHARPRTAKLLAKRFCRRLCENYENSPSKRRMFAFLRRLFSRQPTIKIAHHGFKVAIL